jgi:hypothetical protein
MVNYVVREAMSISFQILISVIFYARLICSSTDKFTYSPIYLKRSIIPNRKSKKGKAVPLHAVEAHGGRVPPEKGPPVPIG